MINSVGEETNIPQIADAQYHEWQERFWLERFRDKSEKSEKSMVVTENEPS